MTYKFLKKLLVNDFACNEEDIIMTAVLDELNLSESEKTDIAFALSEEYGVEITDKQVEEFVTIEDVVACVDDQM